MERKVTRMQARLCEQKHCCNNKSGPAGSQHNAYCVFRFILLICCRCRHHCRRWCVMLWIKHTYVAHEFALTFALLLLFIFCWLNTSVIVLRIGLAVISHDCLTNFRVFSLFIKMLLKHQHFARLTDEFRRILSIKWLILKSNIFTLCSAI